MAWTNLGVEGGGTVQDEVENHEKKNEARFYFLCVLYDQNGRNLISFFWFTKMRGNNGGSCQFDTNDLFYLLGEQRWYAACITRGPCRACKTFPFPLASHLVA